MTEETKDRLEAFNEEVLNYYFRPLWVAAPGVAPKQPKPRAVPYLWKWEMIQAKIMEASELVKPGMSGGAERRVLLLENPGLREEGWGRATQTLTAAVQLIMPGEVAPTHRHSLGAIRFIMQGSGAYTVVDGERMSMAEGDYLLTPPWSWHDHGHEGEGPMIWMDGFDAALLNYLSATFFEDYEGGGTQPVLHPEGYADARYGQGMLRPVGEDKRRHPSPLTAYRWEHTEKALQNLTQLEPDPYNAYAVEFINPSTGGTADASIGGWAQLLLPKQATKAHRHLSSCVYQVFRGSGYTVINGERFDWAQGDFFVIPPWSWHEHVNTSETDPVYLFSINDIPHFERMGIERVEAYQENGGHQEVVSVFQPLLP